MGDMTGNALVTGGSRRVGRGCGLAPDREGADVALTYVENRDAAEATAEEIRALGRRAVVLQADVGDASACVRVVQGAIEELGPLKYLVANAANGTFATIDDFTLEEWDY